MADRWIPLTGVPDDQASEREQRWQNPTYRVRTMLYGPGCTMVVVRRHDDGPIVDWRHLQAIKNETVGPHSEAVEVYPPASRGIPVSNRTRVLYAVSGAGSLEREPGELAPEILPFPWDPRPLLADDEPFEDDPLPSDWAPVRRVGLNPDLWAKHVAAGDQLSVSTLRAYANPDIQGVLRRDNDALAWLSFKWEDRNRTDATRVVWAHLSAVVNGPHGWAVEIYPAEDRLVDEANQFHLWCVAVVPEGGSVGTLRSTSGAELSDLGALPVDPDTGRLTIGIHRRYVADPAWLHDWSNDSSHRGRQRPWQPGLPTGPSTGSTSPPPDLSALR